MYSLLIGVHLRQIKPSGRDFERHTPPYRRASQVTMHTGAKAKLEVTGTGQRAQRQDYYKVQICTTVQFPQQPPSSVHRDPQ